MLQVATLDTTNKASSKDWFDASKDLWIVGHEPYAVSDTKQEQGFTEAGSEQALKKVSRRIRK